jgi:hypothetical protein
MAERSAGLGARFPSAIGRGGVQVSCGKRPSARLASILAMTAARRARRHVGRGQPLSIDLAPPSLVRRTAARETTFPRLLVGREPLGRHRRGDGAGTKRAGAAFSLRMGRPTAGAS